MRYNAATNPEGARASSVERASRPSASATTDRCVAAVAAVASGSSLRGSSSERLTPATLRSPTPNMCSATGSTLGCSSTPPPPAPTQPPFAAASTASPAKSSCCESYWWEFVVDTYTHDASDGGTPSTRCWKTADTPSRNPVVRRSSVRGAVGDTRQALSAWRRRRRCARTADRDLSGALRSGGRRGMPAIMVSKRSDASDTRVTRSHHRARGVDASAGARGGCGGDERPPASSGAVRKFVGLCKGLLARAANSESWRGRAATGSSSATRIVSSLSVGRPR